MSGKYDDNNRGIISKNDRKEQPNHADQTGKCKIEGVEYYINGWIHDRTDGTGKFLSLQFKPVKTKPVSNEGGSGTQEAEDFF